MFTYPDLLFFPSTYSDILSPLEKPNCLVSMHLSTAFLNSNMWMEDLFEVEASKYNVGWNTIELISALLFPLLSSYTTSPPSVLYILMMWPLHEADANRVPSGFTAIAPISVSCAGITKSMLLSTTIEKNEFLCLLTIV